jgi:acetolactate synthase-1/3 small subunit
MIEMAGSEAKIDGLLEVLRPHGVLEMVRTGRVAMARGVGSRSVNGGPAAAIPDAEADVSYSV